MAAEAGREPEGYSPPAAGYEAAAAYLRLREEARLLNERAGWSVEEFDRDVPEPDLGDLPTPGTPSFERENAAYELRQRRGPEGALPPPPARRVGGGSRRGVRDRGAV